MRYSRSNARGMALIISLLLLVAITLLAVSAMRSTTLQEKMAANFNDREIAKQVAEATVRQVGATLLPPPPASGWYRAALPAPVVGAPDLWQDPVAWANRGTIALVVNGNNYNGEYMVENLGMWPDPQNPTCKVTDPLCEKQTYRVTARTAPIAGRASVTLQAIWRI